MKRIAASALAALAILIVLIAVALWAGETGLAPAPAGTTNPQSPTATAPATSVAAVKLYVAQDGLYRVPLADLEAAGLAGAAARAADLALTWHDQPLPRAIDGDALVFYGQASRSPYATESAYWVALTGDTVTPAQRDAAPDGASPRTVYTATLRLKQEQVYYARAPQDNTRWFWTSLTAPRSYTITLALDERAAGPARLRVAAIVFPFGAQANSTRSRPSLVSCFFPLPLGCTSQRSSCPFSCEMKPSQLPSGDQRGLQARVLGLP